MIADVAEIGKAKPFTTEDMEENGGKPARGWQRPQSGLRRFRSFDSRQVPVAHDDKLRRGDCCAARLKLKAPTIVSDHRGRK